MRSRRSTEDQPPARHGGGSRRAALGLCITAVAAIHLALWAWVEGDRAHRPRASGSVPALLVQPGDRPVALTLAEPLPPVSSRPLSATVRPSGSSPRLERIAAEPQAAGELLGGEPFEAEPAAETERYLAPEAVDRPALARSAPDLTLLQGVPYSGVPMRIRLDINAQGLVDSVTLLASGPDDGALFERLRQMWMATPHIPARLAGRDVASSKLIELSSAAGP